MPMGSQILPCSAKHGITLLIFIIHALSFSVAQRSPESTETDPYASMKFSPSLVVIIVVLISALFFMGFFFIYIRRRYDSTNAYAVRPADAVENLSRPGAPLGLDEEVLETFPTFVYSEVKTLRKGNGALECAVCLNEFEDDETLRLIPKCDHVFHTQCIDAWLETHTTCPVCRANLVPQPGESTPEASEFLSRLEAQNDAAASETPQSSQPPEPEVISVNLANKTLNRNRIRGSRSGRPRWFPRSHSTGHSLFQKGEDTERFTLRLPFDVREQIMTNRELNRSRSLVVLPREASSRRGYRTAGGEDSSRRRNSRRLESDRWVFSMAPPFFLRASSLRTAKVAADDANESSVQPASSWGESSPPLV